MTLETWDKEHFHVRETETKAEIDTKTWRRKDVWFDIFGTESLTLLGSLAAAATRKQSLLIFRTTESDHCVQGQAGQAATCDQAALAGVHTQHCSAHTSQNKNSVSVDNRQRSNPCQHYCHYRINYSIRYHHPSVW